MSDQKLTIGRLARLVDVNIETVRYYQRIGLLVEPQKPPVGYRTYPVEYIDRIKFIKRAQQLGFSLREIAELIELGEGNCDNICARAEAKLAQVDQQIRELSALRSTLSDLIISCHVDDDKSHCPIIDSLVTLP